MKLHTKITISGLSLYFALMLVCIYYNFIFHFESPRSFEEPRELLTYIQKIPFSGKWINIDCQTKSLSCEGGTINGYFGSIYSMSSKNRELISSLVLVASLMDSQFYDKHYTDLVINMDSENKGEIHPSEEGRVFIIDHYDYYSYNRTTINSTVTLTENFFDQKINDLSTQKIKSADSLFKMRIKSTQEFSLDVELTISYAGTDHILRLLCYVTVSLIVLGFNLHSAFGILYQMTSDSMFSITFNIYTIFIVLCQDTLFFVMNMMFGISEKNFIFIMISILAIVLICLDCFIILKAWMAQEEMRSYQQNESTSSYTRNILLFLKLYIFELVYIYLIMRYFLDIRLVFLNSLVLIPQIVHNATRRIPPEFSLKYLVNFTSMKYVIFLILRSCPWNIASIEYSFLWPFLGIGVLLLSLLIIKIQNKYGSSALFPSLVKLNGHDYFVSKSMINPNIVALKILNSPRKCHEKGKLNLSDCETDSSFEQTDDICSICHEVLTHKFDQKESNSTVQSLYLQKCIKHYLHNYFMQTPCNHRFHCECLVGWMEIKMACPICRSPLPLIE
jgi:hypothetical protein